MKKSIFKTIFVAGLVGSTLLISACGTTGTMKVSKSFDFLEGQSITDVIKFYGIPDHKDKIAEKDAFVYEYHKDYLKNSIIKGKQRVTHAGCKVTFQVNSQAIVTQGSVIGSDKECNTIYTRNNQKP